MGKKKSSIKNKKVSASGESKKKRTKKTLLNSKNIFHSLYENSTVGLYRTTPDGKILLANPALVKMLGYSSFGELKTKDLQKEGFESSFPRSLFMERMKKDGVILGLESAWKRRDGSTIFVNESAHAIRDSKGKVLYYDGTVEDITEQKEMHEAIKESEAKYHALFETSGDGILIAEIKTKKFIDANPSMCRMLGYTKKQLVSLSLSDIHPADALQSVIQKFEALARGEKLVAENIPCLRKDGSVFYSDISTASYLINGKLCNVGFFRDITERKRTEETLHLSEAILNDAQHIAHIGSWSWDFKGPIKWTDEAYRIYGTSRETFTPTIESLVSLIYPEDRSAMQRWIESCAGGQSPNELEFRVILPDGSLRLLSGRGELFYDAVGRPLYMGGTVQDITERKLAEKKLRNSEAFLDNIIEQSPYAMWISDASGTLIRLNQACCDLLHIVDDEVVGKYNVLKDNIVENQGFLPLVRQVFERGETVKFTLRYDSSQLKHLELKQTASLILDVTISPVLDASGKVTNAIIQHLDITERKQMIEELIGAKEKAEQSDKLKSEFLAQMSHEIRTPLNSIVGNVDYLNDSFGENMDSDARDCFNGIELASKRIIRTINLILNVAELQTSGYKPYIVKIDLNSEVLNKLYLEHQQSAKQKGLELIYKCELKETHTMADEYSLTQIFANLIDNAVKYTKKGKVEILLNENSSGNIMVEIKDTGIGMSKEFLSRIFEPFTQEEQGYTRSFDGNGLGLALVKNYCDVNNAIIEVESEKNVGTTFRITFSG